MERVGRQRSFGSDNGDVVGDGEQRRQCWADSGQGSFVNFQ